MTDKERKRISLLAEVATDYYERGLNQDEIASRLCLSRTRVSRLLKEARERGIISITINYPSSEYSRHYELEERLKSRFRLNDARVMNNRGRDPERRQCDVAVLAAEYILENLKKDMIIGTALGTTMRDTVDALSPVTSNYNITIVQLLGSVPSQIPNCSPQSIVCNTANKLRAHAEYLNIPLFVSDDSARKIVSEDIHNKKVFNEAIFSDMIVTGISNINQIMGKDYWNNYLTDKMYQELIEKKAVGSILSRFFDKNGNEIDCTWNQKCVCIPYKNIKEVPNVVVIASAKEKAQAIYSAIKGQLINTLITDGATATALLMI